MKTVKSGDEITYIYSGGRTKVGIVEDIEVHNGGMNYSDRCVDSHDLDKNIDGHINLDNGETCGFLQVVCINNRRKKNFKASFVLGTEAVKEYNEAVEYGKKWNMDGLAEKGAVVEGAFCTREELEAYIKGINDAVGYLECERMMTATE